MRPSLKILLLRCSLFLAAIFQSCGCRGHNPGDSATLSRENVLMSCRAGESIDAVAAASFSGGRTFVAWSAGGGVSGTFLDGEGRRVGEEIEISREPARSLHADAASCGVRASRILVATTPFTSPTEGNRPALLYSMDPGGKEAGPPLNLGQVGPYSMGVSVSPLCEFAFAALHTGKIGEFDVEAVGVDTSAWRVAWRKTLSTEGLNAFLPSVGSAGNLAAFAWAEKKTVIGKKEMKSEKGTIMFSVLTRDGTYAAGPLRACTTRLPMFAPAISFDGKSMALVYKDHPQDEYRQGLYFLKLDPKGAGRAEPRRVGRADGPGSPILLKIVGGGFSTVAMRRLANDLLVGINLLDAGGARTRREIQLYGHGRKLRNVAAVSSGRRMIAVYTECKEAGCTLYSMKVEL